MNRRRCQKFLNRFNYQLWRTLNLNSSWHEDYGQIQRVELGKWKDFKDYVNIMNFIVRPSNSLLLKMFQKFAIEGQRYFFTAFLISGSESIAKRKKQTRKNSSRLRTARLCGFGGGVSGEGVYTLPPRYPTPWKEHGTSDTLPPLPPTGRNIGPEIT